MAGKLLSRFVLPILLAATSALSWSQAPREGSRSLVSRSPILQLETGFHTAPIRQAALSADGKTLVTAAEDKTLRVWDTEPLRLRRVIHTPQGKDATGKLYAVAITADGALAAASGFIGAKGSGQHRIFLVDLRDGRMVREIGGLPQVVNFLALSPDGARLVAHLGGTQGLRAFRLSDGSEVGRAMNFGAPTYGGAFSKEGNYLATCDDGLLRLFGPDFKLLSQVKAPAPGPFRVSYRPDGKEIALGYAEGARVDLLSAKTLFPVFKPDCQGAQGPLAVVAWSLDGARLYAGGGQDFGAAPNAVCAWDLAGRGSRREVAAARATVGEILPLPKGGLIVAAQDPALVTIQDELKVVESFQALPGDLAQVGSALKLDGAARTLSLGWRWPGKENLAFSVPDLEFREIGGGLKAPGLDAPGLEIRDWRNGERPTLNGKPLAGLEAHEIVRSLSLAKDRESFVLGTDWHLRSYRKSGRLDATVALPAAAWGVNHAADGRHLAAALADGTVRWFSLPELREVAALYLHADGQRWVMWTPEGRYAASVAGESLLGWLVQKEGETGAFFPSQKFRESYLNASALANCLGTAAPAVAPAPVRPTMPPVLRILSPADRSAFSPGHLELQLSVRTYGARDAVRKLHLYLDGGRLPVIENPLPGAWVESDQTFDTLYTVKLPVAQRQDCRVGVAVETDQGSSQLAELQLQYLVPAAAAPVAVAPPVSALPAAPLAPIAPVAPVAPVPAPTAVVPGAPVAAAAAVVTTLSEPAPAPAVQGAVAPVVLEAPPAPRLNLLSIGVADYREKSISLKYPAKDAEDLANVFTGANTKLYSQVDRRLLLNEQATKDGILEALRSLKERARPQDVSVIFVSGHGTTVPSSGAYYFIPYDYAKGDGSALLDGRELQKLLGQTQGKVVMLMDTCHSGNVMGEGRLRSLEDIIRLTRFINDLASAESGVTVFSSSTGGQVSLESAAWNNGAFTKALVEGLGGKADPARTGRVTLGMLDAYLRTRVAELTKGKQTPVSGKPDSKVDFPLALSR